ncbi:hypothetical protein B0H17DRAFT_1217102 [Mycena rosella]|uniref:Uncharacterized protein n=1 Tax=Mycena rosella TaxID=1033263 RepID=A0AAD7FU43_MYCRO|nr:hypothetical protein B0H17DRAFT_1217102 [Mycena rosella]
MYTNLLKVSDMWQIEVSRNYAIDMLMSMYLLPSRCLELAAKFSLYEWVEPAVTEIFEKPLGSLSAADIECIGIKAYAIMVRGEECMEREIFCTANIEPVLATDPSWKCEKHKVCIAVWCQAWWDKIGRNLLHPDHPIKMKDILAEEKKMATKDMDERCHKDVLRGMEANIVFVDKRVIAGVAASIVAYYNTL